MLLTPAGGSFSVTWVTGAPQAWLVAMLNSDILRELTTVDYYLWLARMTRRLNNAPVCHQIAVCSTAALSNATALAAEVTALGGVPAIAWPAETTTRQTRTSVEEQLMDAQAVLAHYQGRLAFTRRFELPRLEELFRGIVLGKKEHLAHVAMIASAIARRFWRE